MSSLVSRRSAFVFVCALLCIIGSTLADSIRVRTQLTTAPYRRTISSATGSIQMDVDPDTGTFTLLGSFQNMTSEVTGIRVKIPGARLPRPIGKKPIYLTMAWSQNGSNGFFSTAGTIPLRRVPSLLRGRATVDILTRVYPRGEIGGKMTTVTPTPNVAAFGATFSGIALVATRRRRRA